LWLSTAPVSATCTDTRFVFTNLTDGTARKIYENIYCRRGEAENHIKE
jgi:hypothetical protein